LHGVIVRFSYWANTFYELTAIKLLTNLSQSIVVQGYEKAKKCFDFLVN